MTMKREFVNVDTESFSATVPSIGMLNAHTLLKIVAEPNVGAQFEIMVTEFRDALTEERRSVFDSLSLDEWGDLMGKWMEVSVVEETASVDVRGKKWWKFW